MSIYAWIYVVLSMIGILIAANEHGKPRKPSNFWISLISWALGASLLYGGGFFN